MPLSLVDYPDSVHNALALTLIAKVEEEEVGMKESVMERRQVWTRRASTSPAELGLLKGTIVGRVVVITRWWNDLGAKVKSSIYVG